MEIVRYVADPEAGPQIGVRRPDGGLLRLPGRTLGDLLALPLDRFRSVVESADEAELPPYRLLAPVDSWTEVWAAGVTYTRSREARMEESGTADVYDRVYVADRPELFFKAPSWRVVGPGEPVGVREDSDVDVPEPELAVVLNAHGDVVGVTICDDVSSRSIEGENPLYLPQAKIYAGACALGPVIRPVWEVEDLHALDVSVEVGRGGEVVWSAATSTTALHRRVEELAAYLFRGQNHPCGAVLSTGTGLVPDLDFTLRTGDEVRITIESVGTLTNPVVRGREGLDRIPGNGWLDPVDGGVSGAA
jgi:2-dehydro-3-deoxy-D-arabinonate dehydratase